MTTAPVTTQGMIEVVVDAHRPGTDRDWFPRLSHCRRQAAIEIVKTVLTAVQPDAVEPDFQAASSDASASVDILREVWRVAAALRKKYQMAPDPEYVPQPHAGLGTRTMGR